MSKKSLLNKGFTALSLSGVVLTVTTQAVSAVTCPPGLQKIMLVLTI